MPAAKHQRVLGQDPIMRCVMATVGRLQGYYRERTDFETVCRIITGQQLSYAAATTIWKRVRALRESWRPEHVASLKPARLLGCGLSRNKATFIPDSCASRRPRHSPGARAAVGDLRAEAIALLPR